RDRRRSGNAPEPACKPSLRDALVRTDGDRWRGHVRELHPPNLRAVRAGGDCGQPRLLRSEPALAGPEAEGPAAGRPAKARRQLRDASRSVSHSAASGTYRRAGRLPFAGKRPALRPSASLDECPVSRDRLVSPAFMRIFPPGCPEICVPHPLASLTLFPMMLPIKSV